MARHKVYVGVDANNKGKMKFIGGRGCIDRYAISINADCNGKQDVSGAIFIDYNKETDEIIIHVNTPDYKVNVVNSKTL